MADDGFRTGWKDGFRRQDIEFRKQVITKKKALRKAPFLLKLKLIVFISKINHQRNLHRPFVSIHRVYI